MFVGDPLDSWVIENILEFQIFDHFDRFRIDGIPMDVHEEQSNIWGPKIDRMKISEYKIIANIRRSFCTIQNEVHFTPDFAVS